MKSIINYILAGAVLFSFSGCTNYYKFKVECEPGTQIYTPDMQPLAVSYLNKTEVSLKSNAYYAYLIAKTPSNPTYIPFALDYKSRSAAGTAAAAWGMIVGGGAVAGGGVTYSIIGGNVGLAVGITAASFGLATMIAGYTKLFSMDYACEHEFKYLNNQTINNDIFFKDPYYTEPAREISYDTYSMNTQPTVREEPSSTRQTRKKEGKTQQLTLGQLQQSKNKDNTADNSWDGTYKGYASLFGNEGVVSQWEDLSINIEQMYDDSVRITVLSAEGEPFFSEKSEIYKVKQCEDGTYELKINKHSMVTVIINPVQKTFLYTNADVKIDGENYYLVIRANK